MKKELCIIITAFTLSGCGAQTSAENEITCKYKYVNSCLTCAFEHDLTNFETKDNYHYYSPGQETRAIYLDQQEIEINQAGGEGFMDLTKYSTLDHVRYYQDSAFPPVTIQAGGDLADIYSRVYYEPLECIVEYVEGEEVRISVWKRDGVTPVSDLMIYENGLGDPFAAEERNGIYYFTGKKNTKYKATMEYAVDNPDYSDTTWTGVYTFMLVEKTS